MATKPMDRKYFPIYRETKNDEGRVVKDPIGVFSCLMPTARFLDIDKLEFDFQIEVTRQGGQRSKTRADSGTTLGGTDAAVSDSVIIRSIKSKGSKTVTIKTGKKIADTKRKTNKDSAFHEISFRFPGWATNKVIADALGEIIPAGKLSSDPGETEVKNQFKVKGGGTYYILAKSVAEASTEAEVPDTEADANNVAQKSGGGKKATKVDAA
ncbi:hypothetical protein JYQ62_16160 [Nostoc sp. UHCC 0702]|nr:hypothetical protein JYQ62_16160 [Nostoc sp. UHCC 0702]